MPEKLICRLKKRLKEELPGEEARIEMEPLRIPGHKPLPGAGKAGVLILLFPRKGELFTLLIKRTEYHGPHSGQISFPGGKSERSDQSQIETALREAIEETGIEPGKTEILGTLTPLYIPVSHLEVLPVVAYTGEQPEFTIDPKEVEYLIYLKISDLTKDDLKTTRNLTVNGITIEAPGYKAGSEFIWGATAMILAEFSELISGSDQTTQ
jgi:8-oxo-dGTP pyrophosphatase MutT (NUDIX family)